MSSTRPSARWPRALGLRAAAALVLAVALGCSAQSEDPFSIGDLLIGAGSSAVQTEGAWNLSGKAESAADHLLHSKQLKEHVNFPDSHDTAADSYNRYKEDVAKAKELKLKIYRFSISWARVLPFADPLRPNPEGVEFYRKLIKEIKDNGITPMVTLYHFDHPQLLQDDFLGWESDQMPDKFAEFADFVFKEFGDEVKLWTTLNEPNQYCMYFNMLYVMGGVMNASDVDLHRCMHHTVLGHLKAYRLYQKSYYATQKGQVGISALLIHAQPESTSVQDQFAADAFNQMHCGQVLHPVVFGDYPSILKTLLPAGKLIEFTDEEKKDLTGATDFIGLNIYNGVTTGYTSAGYTPPEAVPPIFDQLLENLHFVRFDKDSSALLSFNKTSPEVVQRSLIWAWQQYKVPIIVTENGYSGQGLHDRGRAAYFSANLRTVVSTMRNFGVKVKAYCAWSLIDSFEWSAGYNRPFGLVHVDYEQGTLNRTLKDSSSFFIEMADTGVVPLVTESSTSAAISSSVIATLLPVLMTTLLGRH